MRELHAIQVLGETFYTLRLLVEGEPDTLDRHADLTGLDCGEVNRLSSAVTTSACED